MTTYSRRPARSMPWSRAGLFPFDAPGSASLAYNGNRPSIPRSDGGRPPIEPGWLLALKDDVTRSVCTVERMADRVGSMRDDTAYLTMLAANLRRELDMERTQAGRRLVAQGSSMSRQQRRAAAAEACADNLAGMLLDLERQLAISRTQAERLVDAVDHYVTADADPHRLHG